MNNYPDLQHELMILWNSRIKSIEGMKETGRKFELRKPVNYVMNTSQKNYKAIMLDMKKQMQIMRKQMAVLQSEMNEVLKLIGSVRTDEDKKSHAY